MLETLCSGIHVACLLYTSSIEDLQKFNSDEFVNALFDVNMDDIGELHLPEEEAGETDAEE